MTTHTLTVTFDIDAENVQHAVFLLNKWLAEKGVHEKGTIELTRDSNGEVRTMPRFGFTKITTEV